MTGLPRPEGQRWSPADPYLVLLPGGLRVATTRWRGESPAHVSLTIAHRRMSAAGIGVARLTAELIADAPLEDGTRPSLQREVELVGGELRIDVGPASTRFAITVPPWAWRRVLESLAGAIVQPPTSLGRVEEVRGRVVRDLGDRWANDPLDAAVERVLSFGFEGLPDWLSRLEDARLGDVQGFHTDNYRPSAAIAVVATSNSSPQATFGILVSAFEAWTADSTATFPDPLPSIDAAAGVFWGAADAGPRVATVVDLPPPAAPDAAASWILAHCLIGDGAGGRLGQELAGWIDAPVLRARISGFGIQRRIVVSGAARPDQVDIVRRAVSAAVRSLAQDPPRAEELRLAAERARLRLMLDTGEPDGWAGEVTRNALIGGLPDLIVDRDGTQAEPPGQRGDALVEFAGSLERPQEIDLDTKIEALTKRGGLFIALGVDFSATPTFARMPAAVIPATSRSAAIAELQEQEDAARKLLERAVRAVGGQAPLLAFAGYRARSTTRSGRGPQVVDHEWFRLDGQYRRVRHVLASRIETVVGAGGGTESCDGATTTLDETAAQVVADAAGRHPLVLLAGWARGESTYRQVARREIHGRPIAVLERVEGQPGSIRLLVDEESGLPRGVIAREDSENGSVWMRDELRDYRPAGHGLRAPHHRITWVDDSASGLVTTYTELDAETPDPESLQPGGPTR